MLDAFALELDTERFLARLDDLAFELLLSLLELLDCPHAASVSAQATDVKMVMYFFIANPPKW